MKYSKLLFKFRFRGVEIHPREVSKVDEENWGESVV